MNDIYDYMVSSARLDRIQLGAVVEATAAAPEWCYGLTGQVLRIRRPAEWQTEIKLRDGEEWDVYGDYPLPPEPDMEQMMMEV